MKYIYFLLILVLKINNAYSQILNSNTDLYEQLNKEIKNIENNGYRNTEEEEGSSENNYRRWLKNWVNKIPQGVDIEKAMLLDKNLVENINSNTWENYDNIDWQEIGPTKPNIDPLGVSEAGGQKSGPGTGPIEFLKFSPSDPTKMICGSVSGGLFISTNSGQSWINAGSDTKWNRSGCGDAEFSPSTSSTIFASSGGNSGATDPDPIFFTDGIYRTTDGGTTWSLIGDANDFGPWTIIEKIKVHTTNANILMVATNNGLFKTSNALAADIAWSSVSIIKDQTNPQNWVYDLEIMDDVWFIVNAEKHYDKNSSLGRKWILQKSIDNGLTWTEISHPFIFVDGAAEVRDNSGSVITPQILGNPDFVAIEKSANTNNLFFSFAQYNFQNGTRVFEFTPASSSWTEITNLSNIKTSHGKGHGFGISTNPNNDNIPNIILSNEVWYSTLIGNNSQENYNSSSANHTAYHVDIEDFVWHPSQAATHLGEVWMINHGGVAKSTDYGATWVTSSDGLGVAEVMNLTTSRKNPNDILVGLYHNFCLLSEIQTDNTFFWKNTHYGDGQQTIIDNINESIMYTSVSSGSWRRSGNKFNTFGTSFSTSDVWHTTGTINKVQTNVIYSQQSSTITGNVECGRSMSSGLGSGWEIISNFDDLFGITFENNKKYAWDFYNSHSNKDYLYLGIYIDFPENKLIRTKKALDQLNTVINSWEVITLPRQGEFTIVVSELNPEEIYVMYKSSTNYYSSNEVFGNNVLYKINCSNASSPSFINITGNLPNYVGFASLQVEEGTDEGIYIETDYGIFYSNNKSLDNSGNRVWKIIGRNLPHSGAWPNTLGISYSANKIRAGLKKRGVWERQLVCPADHDLSISQVPNSNYYGGNTFYEAQHNITSNGTIGTNQPVSYRAGNEIVLTDGFVAAAGTNFHAFIHPCDHSGNSFNRISDDNEPEFSFGEQDEEDENKPLYTFHPNPNTGQFTLSSTPGYIKNYQLLNIMGQTMQTGKMEEGQSEKTIEISSLAKGIYILQMETTEGIKAERVVYQ